MTLMTFLQFKYYKKSKRLIPVQLGIIFIFLCTCLTISSCAQNSAREYRDFISEMDILTRLDLCFANALTGSATYYTKAELFYIKMDLAKPFGFFRKADNVNTLFTKTADLLLESIEQRENGNNEHSEQIMHEARSWYMKAKGELYVIIPEGKNV